MNDRLTKLSYLLATSAFGLAAVLSIQQFQFEQQFSSASLYTGAAYQAVAPALEEPPAPPPEEIAPEKDFDALLQESVEILDNIPLDN